MKLRIYRNSIRLRLSPADVVALLERSCVRETTKFGAGNHFSYCLQLSPDAKEPRAILEAQSIAIHLPVEIAKNWAQSEAVGIHHTLRLAAGESLNIFIEKDFECLDPAINQPDVTLYPNPNKILV